jgi:hypothetical protein
VLESFFLATAISAGQVPAEPRSQFATDSMTLAAASLVSPALRAISVQAPSAGTDSTPTASPMSDAAVKAKDEGKPNGNGNGTKPPSFGLAYQPHWSDESSFFGRLCKEYHDQFFPSPDKKDEDSPEPPRRALPSPWPSPPFPGSEYQGYPLIGVPNSDTVYPFMKALYGANTEWSEWVKESKIQFSGFVVASGNYSTAKNSNVPSSYWVVPNRFELDQLIFKLERLADTVQTDHIDWGFRSIALYGMDYRYTTAGGWFSDQLLKHNSLYGWDPVEQYFNVYIPGFLGGTDVRIGRWIACPDIETQYGPDNYMGSHSVLFTYDTYTQTGIMVTQKIDDQWVVQGVLHAGTDMAPWYKGALPSGAFGVRWVSADNNDALYTWLNNINSAEFRHFVQYGQPLGHDNFNYLVTTWEHRFSEEIHTNTEAYYMWQYDAERGGTPSAGPVQPFGGGGGDGVLLPGLSRTYGVLNYTMFGLDKQNYITVRNEWFRDERGMRTGYAGTYTSHSIGLSHQINDDLLIRPEIGYYRNWTQPAFDNGTRNGILMAGFDVIFRF